MHSVLIQHIIAVVMFGLTFLLCSRLLVERRAPSSTLAWILTIMLVPYVGIPLYLLIGERKLRFYASKKEDLYSSGAPGASVGNSVELISSGEEAYLRLIKLLSQAKKDIRIATFILGHDDVGRSIVDILLKKRVEGVDVTLLLDALGSLWVPRHWVKEMKAAGIRVAFFNPMFQVVRGHGNLRNHRKIALIDGETAILGGMNLAGEYMGPEASPKRFTDLSIQIRGPSLKDIEDIFISDWHFASQGTLSSISRRVKTGDEEIQILGTGPDVPGDPLYDTFLSELFTAQERIWVATPYFIPDEALVRGFEVACRRGVDVQIIVPKKSNHRLADIARASYLRDLQRAGAKISFFTKGMLHAKANLIDHRCALVASANLDLRSLFLNYEIGVFCYSEQMMHTVGTWFKEIEQDCEEASFEGGEGKKLLEGAGRLLAPLL